MDSTLFSNTIVNQPTANLSNVQAQTFTQANWSNTQISSELGFRLLGLRSFLNTKNHSFLDGNSEIAFSREWTNEIRLVHSNLLACTKYASQLSFTLNQSNNLNLDLNVNDLRELSKHLRNYTVLSESLLRSKPIKFHEWSAWSQVIKSNVFDLKIVSKFIDDVSQTSQYQIPQAFQDALAQKPLPSSLLADFKQILPRFGKILRCLNLIGEMLENDRPLQNALLFLSTIKEQTVEMIDFINQRLLRFKNEDDPMFGALDCAVFATSMEIRKVFSVELGDVTSIRQIPLLYAKIEAAHGLLRDSFQQTLVGFAQIVDPEIDAYKLFPNFQTKFEQSIVLRSELWAAFQNVQKAEKNPETYPMSELNENLHQFMKKSLRYLMYKDWETMERFVEEVIRTTNKTDLVPILHRFGAYLETLFGQVNMRAVLANHPFEYPK
ncbi:MAG: hypothetical protein MUC29_05015 [Pyrinomonadaceae bacterium]|nr:hypothetical protein [Pyrinomonadaceae bacterium]